MGTAVVLFILVGTVAFVVHRMVKDKKAGKPLQCGGNCAACGGHCQAPRKGEEP